MDLSICPPSMRPNHSKIVIVVGLLLALLLAIQFKTDTSLLRHSCIIRASFRSALSVKSPQGPNQTDRKAPSHTSSPPKVRNLCSNIFQTISLSLIYFL